MKKIRIFGVIVLLLAVVVAAVGVFAETAKESDGAFASALSEARAQKAQVESNAKAKKNLDALSKRVDTAAKKLDALPDALRTATEAVTALDEALASGGEIGEADADRLRQALTLLTSGTEKLGESNDAVVLEAQKALDEGASLVEQMGSEKTLSLYQTAVDGAYEAVSAAEKAVADVRDSAVKVANLAGGTLELEEVPVTDAPACETPEDCTGAVADLAARAEALSGMGEQTKEWHASAEAVCREASKLSVSFKNKLAVMLADNFIGVLFTAALLLVIALVMIFLAKPFRRQWQKNPVFSVGIAVLVLLVIQTYALGFQQGSVGAWAKFWFDNTFNVLRANTSVGMIALSMTLVIIIGGIDLAVGSTLAGVGTVLMAMIDTGDHGILVRFGITGVPAFVLGIAAAILTGLAIGAVVGLLVTKGRIPPFIVTLGVMNIVRSVSQYFTKSYKPTVPKEFEVIANKMILGQRPMTILYWLILAVIFYLVMRNTAFGRYVYATGSNERTTRLSGINTDKVKMKVYMISGLVVAIAAVTQLSRLGGMDVASAGSGYELDAIAAVVVGGTAMSGGRGSIVGTVLGVLIIGIMNNLLILLGVDSFLTEAFKGLIVVASVLMQRKEKLA